MTFIMTDDMLRYVKLQRTFLEKARHDRVPELYENSCMADYESIRKALPKKTSGRINILDIGAGMAGIDNVLFNYYFMAGADPHIYILDKNTIADKIKYGYSNNPSAYNSTDLSRKFLELNGVPSGNIHINETYPEGVTFDLILSFISCGFHYPITEYISFIKKSIHSKTMLIFDVRKFSGQFDTLHNAFNWVNCLQITEKYKRMVCRL